MGKVTISIKFLSNNGERASLLPSGRVVCVPGSVVKGNVTVAVHEKIKGDAVILRAYGKEATTVIEGSSSHALGYTTTHSVRTFFQTHSVIGDMKNPTPGTYDFPFSIQLPESLPESLDLYLKQSAHGDDNILIQYGCQARIGSTKMCQDFRVISAPLQAERVPCYLEPKTEAIKTMGFMHGYVTFATGVDNAQIGVGRNVTLSFCCHNHSTVNIERVSIKLAGRVIPLVCWRRVHWHCRQTKKKKILFFIDNLKCRNLKLGKVPRADIQQSRQSAHRENYTYEELQSARNTANIRVRIPEDAQHTYDGSILSISHYFKIYLYTRAFTHNPSIKIPLKIGYAPPRGAALL